MSDSIVEVYAPLQVGIQYSYNKDVTDATISSMKTLLSNFIDILGGSNGKVSPIVAKYLTSNISILTSGTFSDLHCTMLMNDGIQDISFRNEWSVETLTFYNNLKSYSKDLIETESYYGYISDELSNYTTNSEISYNTVLALLLVQGDNILDSNFVTVLKLYNLNMNYLLMLKHVLITSVRAYSILATFISDSSKISIPLIEFDTLLNNISYISCALELYDSSIRPIPLIKEVRKLEMTIQNMRGTIELFSNKQRS